jgi:hypothetical protein
MKKILAGILLLSHINFSMFIAQVDEVDSYDIHGRQTNDINSLLEYVDQVVLGHENKTIPDSDDDNARYFHIVKIADYCFNQQVILLDPAMTSTTDKHTFAYTREQKILSGFHEIVTPPPKADA